MEGQISVFDLPEAVPAALLNPEDLIPGDVVWIEDKTRFYRDMIGPLFDAELAEVTDDGTGTVYIFFYTGPLREGWFSPAGGVRYVSGRREHGVKWRIWDKRPTQMEREAAAWTTGHGR